MTEVELPYAADGLAMRGALFLPDGGGARPGVLVFPEVFGLAQRAAFESEMRAGGVAWEMHLYDAIRCAGGPGVVERDGGAVAGSVRVRRTSFLKKRSKKLL